MLAIVKNITVV